MSVDPTIIVAFSSSLRLLCAYWFYAIRRIGKIGPAQLNVGAR
jgi:hypothetical protein